MSQYPILAFLKLDRPPSVLAHSFLLLLLSGVLLNPYHLSGIIVNTLGLLWPGWLTTGHIYSLQASSDAKENSNATFGVRAGVRTKTREKDWPSQTKRLIDYWTLYSFSTVVESAFAEDTLLALIPLWWVFKILAIVWGSISLSFGAINAADVSNGAREKTRPRPLKLRTNSNLIRIPSPTIAKTSQTSYGDIDSFSSPSPSSSSTSFHLWSSATAVNTSHTNPYPGITTGIDTGTGTRAAAETGLIRNSAQLRALRDELGDISPVLSRTPENLRPRRGASRDAAGPKGKEGPATATTAATNEDRSELFGLSEVDRESETDSHSDSDSDSDSDSEMDSASGSESHSNTNSDSESGFHFDPNSPSSDSPPLPPSASASASPFPAINPNPNATTRPSHPKVSNNPSTANTDDSDDILLPPDTPLDELALRGLKTIELEVGQEEGDEEQDEEQDGNGQLKIGLWKEREEMEKGMEVDPVQQAVFPSPNKPANKPTNPTSSSATRPQNPLTENGEEGSITRLTLDDLLALENDDPFSLPTGMTGMTNRSERSGRSVGSGFGSAEIVLDGFGEMHGVGGGGEGLVGNGDGKRKEVVLGFEPLQIRKTSSAGDDKA
ncbi:hypothetical protein C364_02296 [Cryptococcus neoformans Bt63]|nr:hypothetical protein C364_02296 [Cryptococcus neoformans var. grubii Bt63]